ncbi:MAG TPA: hypothetical protein VIJ67_00365 [Pseudolabrys sp.]
MRRAMVAIGAGLVLGLSTLAPSMAAELPAPNASAGTTAAPTVSAGGPEWCGFHNKAGDRVRCGYSSENDCKQALGEPDAICIVDPYLTENRRSEVNG